MDEIEKKLDKLVEQTFEIKTDICEIKTTLAKQAVVLEDHTRRSLAAEENIGLLREQIKPIEAHVALMGGVGKTLTFIIAVLGVIAGLARLFS
jgi:hypothetical protein